MSEHLFLNELRFCLEQEDKSKLEALFEFSDALDGQTRKEAALMLSRQEGEFVVPYLAEMLDKYPVLVDQRPELKVSLFEKLVKKPSLLIDSLGEDRRGQSIFIEAASELKIKEAVDELINLVKRTQDEKTSQLAIKALGEIGDSKAVPFLRNFLDNAELIISVIEALGHIDSTESYELFRNNLGKDETVDRAIIEVLSTTQTRRAIDLLNELLESNQAHIRAQAKRKLARLGSKVVPTLLENLDRDDVDVLIHTMGVLGVIGDESAVGPIKRLLFHQPNANVRFTAYETLGMLPVRKGAYSLATGLSDRELSVAMAAARAIDRNMDDSFDEDLKKLISSNRNDLNRYVEIIILSNSEKIFSHMISDPGFRSCATKFLETKAPPDAKKRFEGLLPTRSSTTTLKTQQKNQKTKLQIWAVDDSELLLMVYKAALEMLGHEPTVFANPLEAWEQLENMRPDILITDLNMPEMTGIELVKKTRTRYSSQDLPIIMITTQDCEQDRQDAIREGVNKFLIKPFEERQLEKAIASFRQTNSTE